MKKRIFSLILAFIVFASLFSFSAAEAAEPNYTPSKAYKSSVYYQNLLGVKLTGDQGVDLVAVARSQLGYHEGNSESELDGSNKSGSKSFSEYGYWFGVKVKGQSYGHFYDWCAMFISWCARQAGISTSVISNAAYAKASNSVYDFANLTVHHGDGYVPVAGDLIFFCWSGSDSSWDHVGIVEKTVGSTVYTIEGNADNAVVRRTYSLTDKRIRAIGRPAYKNTGNVSTKVYSDAEIASKIDTLYSALRGKRFTTDLADCGNSVCDKCRLSEVIKAQWFKDLFGTTTISQYPPHESRFNSDGWSCYAFAEFASWYIYAENSGSTVVLEPVGTYAFNYTNMKKYAHAGDNLRWDTTAYKSALNHSAIVVSVESDGVTVLDSNWEYGTYGHNYIRKHKIYFNDEDVGNSPVHISTYPYGDTCNCVEKYAGVYTTDNVVTSLTIRSGHGTSFSVLGSIPPDAIFVVTKSNGTWAHVEYNGISGYASMSYMKRSTIRGDVNNNIKVSSADAIYLLRSTMRPSAYPITQSGDMDGDGRMTSADAVYLLRHIMRPDRYPLF